MSDKKNERIEVKVSILAVIHKSLKPFIVKTNSLLEGHYRQEYKFSPPDMLLLLETMVTSGMLHSFLDDLINQAIEARVQTLFLENSEITMISTLAKTISAFGSSKFGQASLMEH